MVNLCLRVSSSNSSGKCSWLLLLVISGNKRSVFSSFFIGGDKVVDSFTKFRYLLFSNGLAVLSVNLFLIKLNCLKQLVGSKLFHLLWSLLYMKILNFCILVKKYVVHEADDNNIIDIACWNVMLSYLIYRVSWYC